MNAFDIKNNTLSAMYQLWGKKTVGGFKVSEEQLREWEEDILHLEEMLK